jgi:hypothetical protein
LRLKPVNTLNVYFQKVKAFGHHHLISVLKQVLRHLGGVGARAITRNGSVSNRSCSRLSLRSGNLSHQVLFVKGKLTLLIVKNTKI